MYVCIGTHYFDSASLKNSNITLHLTPSLSFRSQHNLAFSLLSSKATQSLLRSTYHAIFHCYLKLPCLCFWTITHCLSCSIWAPQGPFLFCTPQCFDWNCMPPNSCYTNKKKYTFKCKDVEEIYCRRFTSILRMKLVAQFLSAMKYVVFQY